MPARSPAEVGALYANRRRSLGLRQLDVCERADISRPTVTSLETGGRVTRAKATAVSRALEWPADAYAQLLAGVPADQLDDAGQISVRQGLDLIELACRQMGMPPEGVDLMLRLARSQVEFPQG